VTWLPFDLHPEYPPEGIPRTTLNARYGEDFHERLKQSFAAAGLAYNPPPDVVPNTLRALSLTELARERRVHRQVHDRIMEAYWDEGLDIGDPEVLVELADQAGLDREDAMEALAGGRFAEEVRKITSYAHSIGVTGVPAFVLDRRLLVLGAQPQTVFERAVEQLRAEVDKPAADPSG
jgi:predicted DsbA family dithiol-disulfide isomerase